MQERVRTFEQAWTDEASGRTLPKLVLADQHLDDLVFVPDNDAGTTSQTGCTY